MERTVGKCKSDIFEDVSIFFPTFSEDIRGRIWTTWNKELYPDLNFKHDKFSSSSKFVLRGLHGDDKTWKLISCVFGAFYLVYVDNRKDSDTFLRWEGLVLSDENHIQVLIPPNFANGHLVLSDRSVFHYKLAYEGDYNDVENQFVIKWNDPRLHIEWPVIFEDDILFTNPILYGRDK